MQLFEYVFVIVRDVVVVVIEIVPEENPEFECSNINEKLVVAPTGTRKVWGINVARYEKVIELKYTQIKMASPFHDAEPLPFLFAADTVPDLSNFNPEDVPVERASGIIASLILKNKYF